MALFDRILWGAKADPNILGFWLDGSRGKGLITRDSDYDCVMLVRDGVLAEYKARYKKQPDPKIELRVKTLEQLQKHAAWGSDDEWDRYNYAHLKPLVDKTGRLSGIFAEKASVPEAFRRKYVSGHLDGYINEMYRSLKCLRDGQISGWRLHAAQSVTPLLKVLYGMHGRVPPFLKYLEWDLKNFPLEKLTMSPDELVGSILKITTTGSVREQQRLFGHMEAMARGAWYDNVFESWGSRLAWIKSFRGKPAGRGVE